MTIADLKAKFSAGVMSKADFICESYEAHKRLFDYVDVIRPTDVKEIRITPTGVLFLLGDDDIWLECPPGEARVAPVEILNFDRYEPSETRVMDLLSAGAGTVLDIGANIGWHTIRFARRLPSARVFAFEPLPASFSYLQRNIALNHVGANAVAFNYGLSDTAGSVQFFIAPKNGTNASLKNVADSAEAQAVVGLTLTLDQWAHNYRVAPDFIKCDVEGAELLVFRGGKETLVRHSPVVFTELLRKWSRTFGYTPNEMIGFFEEIGYSCFGVGEKAVRPVASVTEETAETNYAFLHREAHVDLIAQLARLK